MPRIPLVDERSDDPAGSHVFQEIRTAFGRVPNLFRTYAAHPPLLQAS